jgi:membrane protein DedA with SNARE-associated domain
MLGGFLLGNNWDMVKLRLTQIFDQYNKIIIVLAGILLIVYITLKIIKKFKKPTQQNE